MKFNLSRKSIKDTCHDNQSNKPTTSKTVDTTPASSDQKQVNRGNNKDTTKKKRTAQLLMEPLIDDDYSTRVPGKALSPIQDSCRTLVTKSTHVIQQTDGLQTRNIKTSRSAIRDSSRSGGSASFWKTATKSQSNDSGSGGSNNGNSGAGQRAKLGPILLILFGLLLSMLIGGGCGISPIAIKLVHSAQVLPRPQILNNMTVIASTSTSTTTPTIPVTSKLLSSSLSTAPNVTRHLRADVTQALPGMSSSNSNLVNNSNLPAASPNQVISMTTVPTGAAMTTLTTPTTTVPLSEDDVESDTGGDESENDSAEPVPAAENGNQLSPLLTDTIGEALNTVANKMRSAGSEESSTDDDGEKPVESSPLIAATNANKKRSAADEELSMALETYTNWRRVADELIELFSKKMMPAIMEHGYDIDGPTMTGLLQVFNGIRQLKPWALKLLDASTKISPGILVGTQSDFGDFDECLKVRVDDPSGLHADSPIEYDELTGLPRTTTVGRYCLADLEFPKPGKERLSVRNEELGTDYAFVELRRPLYNFSESAAFKDTIFVETGNFFHMLHVDPLRVGICLTNKIDPDSFAKTFNKLFEEFKISINFRGRCSTKYDRPQWTSYQRVSGYVVATACALVILSTLLEILHLKLHKLPLPKHCDLWKLDTQSSLLAYQPFFTSFSILRNTRRLFRVESQKSPSSAVSESGIRQVDLNMAHEIARCTTSVSISGSSPGSSSLESSPSIERRSSAGSSGVNLISGKSILNNTVFIPGTNETSQQVNLRCFHGIRVITMTWMIINHTYMFGGFFIIWAHRRLIDIAEWPKSLSFQLVLNGWLTVETYFFLSATIIVLNALPMMKKRRFSYISYVLHRLVRLMPAYIGIICLNFLWPLVSSGPIWLVKGKSFIQQPCENYLWTNLLFINNWIWPEKQCMVHTWFLSADFQLYLLAPIIVYLLYRRPVLGHSLTVLVAILGSVLSGLVIYANKLLPTTLINKLEFDAIKQQLSYSYFATYQHLGPYCLGIFIGYLLHKRPTARLPKHLTWTLWILLPPLSFTTLLLTYLWNGAYDDPNLINPSPLVSALYVAIHRTIWTSLLAWIVFACATGRAKLMSSFLSHRVFIPISRLSYSIYLVHLPVIMYRSLNLRQTIEWTDANILYEACGNFVASVIVGFFVNIAFESPMINLENIISGRSSARPTSQATAGKAMSESGDSSKNSLTSATNSLEGCEKSRRSSSLQPQQQVDLYQDASAKPDQVTDSSESIDDSKPATAKESPSSIRSVASSSSRNDSNNQATSKAAIRSGLSGKATRERELARLRQDLAAHNLNETSQQMPPSSTADMFNTRRRFSINNGRSQQHEWPSSLSELNQTSRNANYVDPQSLWSYRTLNNRRTTSARSDLSQQQQQQAQYGSYGVRRAGQYATLARTSRFNHERMQTDRVVRPSLDGPSSQMQIVNAQQRLQAPYQRHRRYNTLSGTGSSDWRSQYSSAAPQEADGWLQASGNLIPRIDSSTLRRQSAKQQQLQQRANGLDLALEKTHIEVLAEEEDEERILSSEEGKRGCDGWASNDWSWDGQGRCGDGGGGDGWSSNNCWGGVVDSSGQSGAVLARGEVVEATGDVTDSSAG